MANRDEIVAAMKRQLDEMNAGISELEAKADSGKAGLSKQYDEQLTKLRGLQASASAKAAELKHAGDDKWQELAAESDKFHKAFVHSWNYFKSQVK